MRYRMLLLAVPMALGLMACTPTTGRERPFSDGWVHEIRTENERARRVERIGPRGLPFFGDSEKSNAGVRVDESGKASLGLGNETGWSAGVDYRRSPEPKIKYKKEWDFHKPQRERAQRR
jgi:hypothetical protein